MEWCGGTERVTALEVKQLVTAARSRSASAGSADDASAG